MKAILGGLNMERSIITGWFASRGNRGSHRGRTIIFAASAIVILALGAFCHAQYSSRSSRRRIVQLSEPALSSEMSIEQALARRRDSREFTGQPLTASQVGQLGWAGNGPGEIPQGLRAASSTGVTHPMRLYFATDNGVFLYNPLDHSLEQSSDRDVRGALAASVRKREVPLNVGCYIVIVGSARDLVATYGKKARSYMPFEAGRIAQRIQLQAVTLGLGTFGIAGFDKRQVAKSCRVARKLEPVYMLCVGYPLIEQDPGEEELVLARKVLMIIASSSFEDAELFETKFVLEQVDIEVVVASSVTGPVMGLQRGTAESVISLSEVEVADYDAIVFIGGVGAHEYFDNPATMEIARNAIESGKILAAIGIAPRILANAGVLIDVRVTCVASEQDKLKNAGATYTGAPVEHDGLIITARDGMVAVPFGRAIADALTTGQQ